MGQHHYCGSLALTKNGLLCHSPRKAWTTWRTWPMSPQLYGVCYCLSNSYAIVFSYNRRFNYRPEFQEQQSPHPLISCRAVRRRHYRSKIKSRWKLPGRQWESNPQPSEQLRPMTIKTSASAETAIAAVGRRSRVRHCRPRNGIPIDAHIGSELKARADELDWLRFYPTGGRRLSRY